jgi:hypothetical protein
MQQNLTKTSKNLYFSQTEFIVYSVYCFSTLNLNTVYDKLLRIIFFYGKA